MARIEIYTTPICPYCSQAKALFNRKHVAFEEIDVMRDHKRRAEMEQRARRTSVPQIFIDGAHIGGCDDLYALDRAGGLDPKLGQ